MRKRSSILFIGAIATQVGATNCGEVLRDPGYDLWCGDELCAWQLERGEIKRIPTWHAGDSGVELVGPDTAISQLTPLDSADGHCRDLADGTRRCTSPDNVCIELTLMANIDEAAVVDLNIDVFDNGTFEHTQRLPIAKWEKLVYRIVIGQPFAGVRFQLAKTGSGTAQLANIGARLVDNCDGLPVFSPGPVPLGSPCEDSSQCETGFCAVGLAPVPFPGVFGFLQPTPVCVECNLQNACGADAVCGIGEARSPVRAPETVCVPRGEKQLGEACFSSAECATGFCTGSVCSTCNGDADCDAGETCGETWNVPSSPWVCAPNAHLRQSGEPCASHDDCASATCLGKERRQCDDGRPCVTAAQCPFAEGLKNGACTTVGIQGGICR